MTTSANDMWQDLLTRYYDGCTRGDVAAVMATLHPEVVHWFLAPNIGSKPVRGTEHLARYWRKVAALIEPRWVIDHLCATPDEAVIEWTMFWRPSAGATRIATRGSEWFTLRDGRIAEIRSYYQQRADGSSELDGFPYAERGYSTLGSERSEFHPGD
jgi:ketosteroid isomerase-like protein